MAESRHTSSLAALMMSRMGAACIHGGCCLVEETLSLRLTCSCSYRSTHTLCSTTCSLFITPFKLYSSLMVCLMYIMHMPTVKFSGLACAVKQGAQCWDVGTKLHPHRRFGRVFYVVPGCTTHLHWTSLT
jgi:hypothetical protein